jgi:hypothetical protein
MMFDGSGTTLTRVMEPQHISSMATEFTTNPVNLVPHTINLTETHYVKGFSLRI